MRFWFSYVFRHLVRLAGRPFGWTFVQLDVRSAGRRFSVSSVRLLVLGLLSFNKSPFSIPPLFRCIWVIIKQLRIDIFALTRNSLSMNYIKLSWLRWTKTNRLDKHCNDEPTGVCSITFLCPIEIKPHILSVIRWLLIRLHLFDRLEKFHLFKW